MENKNLQPEDLQKESADCSKENERIKWCHQYLDLTLMLKECLDRGKITDMQTVMKKRREMLEAFSLLPPSKIDIDEEETFKKLIKAIKDLEKKCFAVIKSSLNGIVNECGRMNKYRRSLSTVKVSENPARYIDIRS